MRAYGQHVGTLLTASAGSRWGRVVAARVPIVLRCIACGALVALAGFAPSSARANACPNETLRAEANSISLPDCRAYELVSPAYKQGYELKLAGISPSGEAVTGSSLGSFAGSKQDSNLEGAFYEIGRGASGWSDLAISPPAENGDSCNAETTCFATPSAQGDSSLWVLRTPTEPRGTIYRRETSGDFVAVGPMQPTAEIRTGEQGASVIVGASSDLQTVLFTTPAQGNPRNKEFWPGDSTVDGGTSTGKSLYEYTGTGNSAPLLVGVHGSEASSTSAKAQLISQCGTELGSEDSMYNALSRDGEVVFFTAESGLSGTCEGPNGSGEYGTGPAVNELWARVDGTESVPISEPSVAQCTECHTAHTTPAVVEQPAVFQGASEDGTKVFFTTEQELLPGTKGDNLYEYDFDAPQGQKVSLLSGAAQPAELKGVARIAPDGARVYYIAGAVLASNKNAENATAQAGAQNLYVYDSQEKLTSFVATVWSSSDQAHALKVCLGLRTGGEIGLCEESVFTYSKELWRAADRRPAVTTEDGQYFVFQSSADITKDDTGVTPQVFEYNAVNGELTRVSRGQDGYNNNGNTNVAPAFIPITGYTASDKPGGNGVGLPGLSGVSADGSEVVFSTGDALTPGALDEDEIVPGGRCLEEEEGECIYYEPAVLAENFYEYRSEGAISDGQVSLIDRASTALATGGVLPLAGLRGIDASGNDIFFSSTEPLVGQVADTEINWYDARVDGGFPAPRTPTGCSDDSCQGPLAAAPALQPPLTAMQPGGENLTPTIKPLTQTQELKQALKRCKRKKNKKERENCERRARKRYGGEGKANSSKRSRHHKAKQLHRHHR